MLQSVEKDRHADITATGNPIQACFTTYLDSHVVMLDTLVLAELLLASLDGDILQEVCIAFGLRALKAQLAEERHHLSIHTSMLSCLCTSL